MYLYNIHICIYTIFICIHICMNVKQEFFQKCFFKILKTSYISLCSKTFLRMCINKNCKYISNINNSKTQKNN